MQWLVMLAMMVLALAPVRAQQAPARPPVAAPTARIVPQAIGHSAGIDVALWTPDSRFLITANGSSRNVMIWDVQNLWQVDVITLPKPVDISHERRVYLTAMTLLPDGRTLRIDGEGADFGASAPGGARPDHRAARAFLVDLQSRQVSLARPQPLRPLADGAAWDYWQYLHTQAYNAIYAADRTLSRARADAILPALPRSPDGQFTLVRSVPSWSLRRADGSERRAPNLPNLSMIYHADLAGDDRHLAMSSWHADLLDIDHFATRIDVIDISTGRFLPSVHIKEANYRLKWHGKTYWAFPENRHSDNPDYGASAQPLPPAVRVDPMSGRVMARVPARCFMVVLPDGALVGAGLGNCRSRNGDDRTLQRWTGTAWRPLPGFRLPAGNMIRALAAAPVGDRLAVVVRKGYEQLAIMTANAKSGATDSVARLDDHVFADNPVFSQDGTTIFFGLDQKLSRWIPASGAGVVSYPVAVSNDHRIVPMGGWVNAVGEGSDFIAGVDVSTGEPLRDVRFPATVAIGTLRSRPLIWAVSATEGLRIWNSSTGQAVLASLFFPDRHFVAYAADGRYDTNLPPGTEDFRWLISDSPFDSLPPQTLMRDFYTPQMFTRLLDCAVAGTCAAVLPPLPALATLNRQLPIVQIKAVRSAGPGLADVEISVTQTTGSSGRASGGFGAKLLMNNREVAQNPVVVYPQRTRDLQAWRQENRLDGAQIGATTSWTQRVSLPSDGSEIEFAAYAFNADRVKSNTVRQLWTPPPMPPRRRRAFVLTIGVNDYADTQLPSLTYAVPDARIIGERLAAIPGYEMRRAHLTTGRLPGGGRRLVTSNEIWSALGILAGDRSDGDVERWRAAGHDVSALELATPDDIVIISFSGHGLADKTGSFALLASDTRPGGPDGAPDPATVLNADALAAILRRVPAGEIAFIIDACHAGAAVDTPDFKPGPMGDAGLGQLAYDKGIRILAATQASDLALESGSLSQGLLTAALSDGLPDTGLPADTDNDQRVVLDEWLRYAVTRLPGLHEEVRRGRGPLAARGWRMEGRAIDAPPPRLQLPSLFDFNTKPSQVRLRGQS